jgi:hypothetical protein
MAFDRVAEVEELLAHDDHREGRLWRWYRDGKTDAEWQAANHVKTAPTNSRHSIAALSYGVVPDGPSYAEVDARVFRRWLKAKTMSADLRAALTAQLSVLERIAGGGRRGTGAASATPRTSTAARPTEVERRSGVYVYCLPFYLSHPVDPETGRTLLKVGHSSVDVFSRVARQSRTTALPEDPVLLRIYPSESSSRVEAQFHDRLIHAGHLRPDTTVAGKEWFLTTVEFLDRVASELGLEIEVVHHP